jgi:hypothetical protein
MSDLRAHAHRTSRPAYTDKEGLLAGANPRARQNGCRLSNDDANKGLHFIKIDVDELPQLAQQLGIRAMPTFIFFKDGEKAQELIGADPGTLSKLVEKYRPAA